MAARAPLGRCARELTPPRAAARNELALRPLTPDSDEFFRQMVTLRYAADLERPKSALDNLLAGEPG